MEERKDVLQGAKVKIDKNLLQYEDSIIQLSNISQAVIAPMPKLQYPAWANIGLVLGLLALKLNVVIAIIILLLCGSYIFYVYHENENMGKYLILELNSGKSIFFSSKDEKFLKKVLDVLTECFNGETSTCFINFGNCQIGDNNTINRGK